MKISKVKKHLRNLRIPGLSVWVIFLKILTLYSNLDSLRKANES